MPEKVNIRISYFAAFREKRGLSQEALATEAQSAGELFDQLSHEYGFTLPRDLVRVAINKEFRSMDSALSEGDEVVFIPPVAGG